MQAIRVRDLVSGTILAGAVAGTDTLRSLTGCLPPKASGDPTPLFLDFSGIELATASFLRESIIPFKAVARHLCSSWYPVAANISPATVEDLDVICRVRADAMLVCRLDDSGVHHDAQLVGHLDAKQKEAFDFVTARGEATAKELMDATKADSGSPVSPTAWNNRLTALVEKRVIADYQLGRQKVYVPILRVKHGY